MDRLDGSYELISDDEIIANITEKGYEINKNTSEEEDEPSSCVSHQIAHDMFIECIDWYEKHDEADFSSLMLLRKIKNLSMKKAWDSYKQTKITNLFRLFYHHYINTYNITN